MINDLLTGSADFIDTFGNLGGVILDTIVGFAQGLFTGSAG